LFSLIAKKLKTELLGLLPHEAEFYAKKIIEKPFE